MIDGVTWRSGRENRWRVCGGYMESGRLEACGQGSEIPRGTRGPPERSCSTQNHSSIAGLMFECVQLQTTLAGWLTLLSSSCPRLSLALPLSRVHVASHFRRSFDGV